MSPADGSLAPVNAIVASSPSVTGPSLPSVAAGATLATVTEPVRSVLAPSFSRIAARTATVPLSGVNVVALVLEAVA